MALRVTMGPTTSPGSGARDAEVEVPQRGWIGLPDLLAGLRVSLRDSEGTLLVFVNDRLLPAAEVGKCRLRDGDRLSLHRMLSGG